MSIKNFILFVVECLLNTFGYAIGAVYDSPMAIKTGTYGIIGGVIFLGCPLVIELLFFKKQEFINGWSRKLILVVIFSFAIMIIYFLIVYLVNKGFVND